MNKKRCGLIKSTPNDLYPPAEAPFSVFSFYDDSYEAVFCVCGLTFYAFFSSFRRASLSPI